MGRKAPPPHTHTLILVSGFCDAENPEGIRDSFVPPPHLICQQSCQASPHPSHSLHLPGHHLIQVSVIAPWENTMASLFPLLLITPHPIPGPTQQQELYFKYTSNHILHLLRTPQWLPITLSIHPRLLIVTYNALQGWPHWHEVPLAGGLPHHWPPCRPWNTPNFSFPTLGPTHMLCLWP